MIDEAHATGVLGATGRGAAEHFGLLGAPEGTPDITVGTLSKALGSEGGYVCGSARLIEYLKNSARSFIFSTALSPRPWPPLSRPWKFCLTNRSVCVVCGKTRHFSAARLQELGIAAYSDSAIVPLRVGDEKAALNAAQHLFNAGLLPLGRPLSLSAQRQRPAAGHAAQRSQCSATGRRGAASGIGFEACVAGLTNRDFCNVGAGKDKYLPLGQKYGYPPPGSFRPLSP